MDRNRVAITLIAAAVALALAGPAFACPVCFGETDSPMARGMNNGILFLIGVIASVQIGFVALFVSFRRRSKQYEDRKESFEVIDGNKGSRGRGGSR